MSTQDRPSEGAEAWTFYFCFLVLLPYSTNFMNIKNSIGLRDMNAPGHTRWRGWYAPLVGAILGIISVPVAYKGLRMQDYNKKDECIGLDVDGDVAGEGVRMAVWMQVIILVIISFVGTFHSKASGAKEIGAGLLVTHLSLIIALLVQLAQGTLSPVDALIGCMILDAQNLALSIQLTARETLNSRWQVTAVLAIELLGLGVILLLMTKLLSGALNTDRCSCLKVVWWSWLDSCPPEGSEAMTETIMAYFSFRMLNVVVQSFNIGFVIFNLFKNCGREYTPDLGFIHGHDIEGKPLTFRNQYPATISSTYAMNGVFAVASLFAAELVISQLNLQPTSSLNSTGQIMSLVIASATVIRAIWLLSQTFSSENRSKFIWPFPADTSKYAILEPGTFIVAERPQSVTDSMYLGDIWVEHVRSGMFKQISLSDEVPKKIERRAETKRYKWWSTTSSGTPLSPIMDTEERTVRLNEERLEEIFFIPEDDYIQRRLQSASFWRYLAQESWSQKVLRRMCKSQLCMVTSVIVRTRGQNEVIMDSQEQAAVETDHTVNGTVIAYKLATVAQTNGCFICVDQPRVAVTEYEFIELLEEQVSP